MTKNNNPRGFNQHKRNPERAPTKSQQRHGARLPRDIQPRRRPEGAVRPVPERAVDICGGCGAEYFVEDYHECGDEL